jgi:HD-GYP domain-containing protein (c-di-GMP phosphodiesterase class II)
MNAQARRWKGVSAEFERFVLIIILAFSCYRLTSVIFVPAPEQIPDELLLSITLFLIGYLWIRRSKSLADLVVAQNLLRDAHMGAIGALVEALEAKDEYIRGHSERVRYLSVELAKKLRLSEESIGVVSRSAILHDIGKLGVPDAILHKRDSLTRHEVAILEAHPRRTAEILSALGFLGEESRVALLYHERYNGSGYCMGLKGDEIPLESSIIAVVDAFDAMNSRRPYRHRLSPEEILAELKKGRGIEHNPVVVDAFLKLLAERPEVWG